MKVIEIYDHDYCGLVALDPQKPGNTDALSEGLYVDIDTARRLREQLERVYVGSGLFDYPIADLLDETKELAE